MSWSFNFSGTRTAVKKEVDKQQAYGTDQSQIDRAKALIIREINDLPNNVTGVRVEASGHHDQSWRTFFVRVEPVHLLFDEADVSPAPPAAPDTPATTDATAAEEATE